MLLIFIVVCTVAYSYHFIIFLSKVFDLIFFFFLIINKFADRSVRFFLN